MIRAEAARKIAADRYVKRGTFEIDPDCDISVVPTGIWVQSWVFVSAKEISEEMEEDVDQ